MLEVIVNVREVRNEDESVCENVNYRKIKLFCKSYVFLFLGI